MAVPNLSELVVSTLTNQSKKVADNVTKNNALLNRIAKKGNAKPFGGGRDIQQDLAYQENSTYTRYTGFEKINIEPSDHLSCATFGIKQAAVAVTISGLEQIQNSGKEQLIDLLESRVNNAFATLENNIDIDLHSDGTASSNKQITGLQALVAEDPTSGTVGGINRATWAFWRNAYKDVSSAVATVSNIQSYFNEMIVTTTRGVDRVNLILADNNYYMLLLASLQASQRFESPDLAEAGFMTLKYMGADVVLGGGYGGAMDANKAYFLNTKHLFWRPFKDRNFVVIGGERESVDQDAVVKLFGVAGNMTMDCAFTQGVLFQ